MNRPHVTPSPKRRIDVIDEPEAIRLSAVAIRSRMEVAFNRDKLGQRRGLDLLSSTLTAKTLKSYAGKLSPFAEICHDSENVSPLEATTATHYLSSVRDAAWHNMQPGHEGPLRDTMDMSEYTGMVFGTKGEWREEQTLQEDTTTASMGTDRSQEHQDAGAGTRAICTGPLANLELPTVEQLAEAIAATISHRTNTAPELQHAQWLTDTMIVAGVEMHLHHTETTLLRVGDDNLCAISLGKEDEEFVDTMRLAVALSSHVALLRAIRLRTIVIYLTESEFDPSEMFIHPFSQTIREAGELRGNIGHNQIRHAAIGMRKKARKTALASLALRATGRPIYTLTLQLTTHPHSIIGGTRGTDRTDQWRKTAVSTAPSPTATYNDPSNLDRTQAPTATATPVAHADDEEELELSYEENDSAMEVDITQGEEAETQELIVRSSLASQPAVAVKLASLVAESHQLSKPQRISIQLERHPSQPTPAGKGKTAT
eukprot:jgi/Tetstr1/429501/TSEL_019406.t1